MAMQQMNGIQLTKKIKFYILRVFRIAILCIRVENSKGADCGAAYVYEHYVRPIFVNQQMVNIWYVPRKNDALDRSDDILSAAARYIETNGPEEFEKLISKAERTSKSSNNNRAVFEDVSDRKSKFWTSGHSSFYDEDLRY